MTGRGRIEPPSAALTTNPVYGGDTAMADEDPITLFPADIDRDAFGNWLSGFTAGEGTFALNWKQYRDPIRAARCLPSPNCTFAISLRNDDRHILEVIRSYWRAGTVKEYQYGVSKPFALFQVQERKALVSIVIPHFERYPLFAKKARDFAIWRRGVELTVAVGRRPCFKRSDHRFATKWTEAERAEFDGLRSILKEQRRYDTDTPLELPMPHMPDERQLDLFS